jgi:hypothetical protein
MRPSHFCNLKGRISGVKERKNTCELDFSISNKTRLLSPNYVPRGETVTAASIFNNWLRKKGVKMFSQLHFSHISHQRPFIPS